MILAPRSSKLSRIEDRTTRRTFRGYRENDLIITRKITAKDKALDKRLFLKHPESSQTLIYFHIALDSSFSQALSKCWCYWIGHALHLYLRLQKCILEHTKFELTSASSFLRSQNRQNNQTTDKNASVEICLFTSKQTYFHWSYRLSIRW